MQRNSYSRESDNNGEMITVWDPLVRLFHWSLVASCLLAYITQEQEYELHLYAGYTVLALLSIRLVWGFVGPGYARFSDFVRGSGTILNYLKQLLAGSAPRFLGHNPAGGAMIVAMIATLLLISISGVALDAAENRAGPLRGMRLFLYTDIISDIHELSTHFATLLVPLHLLGVAVSSRLHGENLVRSMIDGKKRK